jgi:hypothetical protein
VNKARQHECPGSGAAGPPRDSAKGQQLADPEDEPTDYHLYQALTDAAKEMEVDWPAFFDWKRSKTHITEIAIVCLLFAALIGFAIVSWEGLGYICHVSFSLVI